MPKVVHKIFSQIKNGQLIAPKKIPKKIAMIKETAPPPPAPVGVVGSLPGSGSGVYNGILGGTGTAPAPPPPTPSIVRIGGNVLAAKKISGEAVQYPAIAKAAHIQGVVVLHAIIAKDGTIQDLSVISGPGLLVSAAMQAVRTWRYAPTLLNGVPVKVDSIIRVNFTLGD